jgi:hypothetical protein
MNVVDGCCQFVKKWCGISPPLRVPIRCPQIRKLTADHLRELLES